SKTAETLSCMGDLMYFCRSNPSLTPKSALEAFVNQIQLQQQHNQQAQQNFMSSQQAQQVINAQAMQNAQQGLQGRPNMGGPMMHQSPHMSMAGSMSNTPVPESRGLVPPSPHLGQASSPASNNLQAPGQPPQQLSLSNPPSSQNS